MIQGMSGLMSITGLPDGAPGGMPMKVGVAGSDVLCGLYAAIGVLAALAHRDRTGSGQHIDLALLDVQVAALANQALNYLVSGQPPGRLGNAHPNIVPYEVFQAADDHFILAVGNDGQFRRFCEVAGRPDLSVDLRFATNPARVQNRAVLVPLLADVIAVRRRADWLTALEAAGVPCGPINTLDQVFDDAQVRARGLRLDLPYGDGGTAPSVACPIKLSVTPAVPEQGPPRTRGADGRRPRRDPRPRRRRTRPPARRGGNLNRTRVVSVGSATLRRSDSKLTGAGGGPRMDTRSAGP